MQRQFKDSQNNGKISISSESFSLEKTLLCGQTFRVFEKSDGFILPFEHSILKLSQKKDGIYYVAYGKYVSQAKLKNFLGLNDDIELIDKELLNKAKKFLQVIQHGKGLRIMRQDPYETTISFLFSIQSPIPTIKKRLNLLSKMAGERIQVEGETYYLFPENRVLRKMNRQMVKELHLGFREEWFLEFIQNYDKNFFKRLSAKDFEEKEKILLSYKRGRDKGSSLHITLFYE